MQCRFPLALLLYYHIMHLESHQQHFTSCSIGILNTNVSTLNIIHINSTSLPWKQEVLFLSTPWSTSIAILSSINLCVLLSEMSSKRLPYLSSARTSSFTVSNWSGVGERLLWDPVPAEDEQDWFTDEYPEETAEFCPWEPRPGLDT